MNLVLSLTLLMSVAAAATTADDIARLDADVAELQAATLSADPTVAKREIVALTASLKDLEKHARLALEHAGSAHLARVLTRKGEGRLAFARALLEAPCPEVLKGKHCEAYQGELARHAVSLVDKAEKPLEHARQEAIVATRGANRLKRADVKRLDAARQQLDVLGALAKERAPEPVVASVFGKSSDPVPFGAPGPALTDFPEAPRNKRGADAADPDTDFVLVDKTAWFTAHEDGSGVRIRGATEPAEGGVPQVWTARLLEERGDRVHLEFGPGHWGFHCAWDTALDAAWRVRMWVDRDALHTLTTAVVTQEFPDGTSVVLAPGVPLVDGGVQFDGLQVPVMVPKKLQGTTYRESDAFGDEKTEHRPLESDASLHIGGKALTRAGTESTLYAIPLGEGTMAVASSCGRIEAKVSPYPDEPTGGLGGLLGGMVGAAERFSLQAGTALWWPDGTRAGTLVFDRSVDQANWPEMSDGTRCEHLVMDRHSGKDKPSAERLLEVCIRPAE
jgi:hypothetical protein